MLAIKWSLFIREKELVLCIKTASCKWWHKTHKYMRTCSQAALNARSQISHVSACLYSIFVMGFCICQQQDVATHGNLCANVYLILKHQFRLEFPWFCVCVCACACVFILFVWCSLVLHLSHYFSSSILNSTFAHCWISLSLSKMIWGCRKRKRAHHKQLNFRLNFKRLSKMLWKF